MKIIPVLTLALACSAVNADSAASSDSPVDTGPYETHITFDTTSVNGVDIDSIVVTWETDQTGWGQSNDLTNLTFTLFNGSEQVYEDIAVLDSSPMDIGGAERTFHDISFDFDLGGSDPHTVVETFDNDWYLTQSGNASGLTYSIYYGEGDVMIAQYFNGTQAGSTATITDFTITTNVPEPGHYAVAAGLLTLALLSWRRQAN